MQISSDLDQVWGATNAISTIRRLLAQSGSTHDDNVFLLLDWEKVFDKITHGAFFQGFKTTRYSRQITGYDSSFV